MELNVIKLDDDKEYIILDTVVDDNNKYLILINKDDNNDMCVRKVETEDGKDFLVKLDTLDEFNKIINLFQENISKKGKNDEE